MEAQEWQKDMYEHEKNAVAARLKAITIFDFLWRLRHSDELQRMLLVLELQRQSKTMPSTFPAWPCRGARSAHSWGCLHEALD